MNTHCHDLAEIGSPLKGDDALFEALLSGSHVENAAMVAQMSVRTAHRRLADPVFRKRLEEARLDLRDGIKDKLTQAVHHAIDRTWELLDDDDPMIRLRACKTLLDTYVKTQVSEPRRRTTATYTVEENSTG